MARAAVDLNEAKEDYPLASSDATMMLSEALNRVQKEEGWSQRQVAKLLDYKTSVVISHMASGRVPIPVDRALDFARLLKIDPGNFLLAVLQQRHPEIDFTRLLSGITRRSAVSSSSRTARGFVVQELESLAGVELDALPKGTVNVLRDAIADREPRRRWAALSEVPLLAIIRKHHPDGLSHEQRQAFEAFVATL